MRQSAESKSSLAATAAAEHYDSSKRTGLIGASCSNKANVANNTRRCCAASPGLPIVPPRFNLVNVAREGIVTRVRPAFHVVMTDGIPASSNARTISPPD